MYAYDRHYCAAKVCDYRTVEIIGLSCDLEFACAKYANTSGRIEHTEQQMINRTRLERNPPHKSNRRVSYWRGESASCKAAGCKATG